MFDLNKESKYIVDSNPSSNKVGRGCRLHLGGTFRLSALIQNSPALLVSSLIKCSVSLKGVVCDQKKKGVVTARAKGAGLLP